MAFNTGFAVCFLSCFLAISQVASGGLISSSAVQMCVRDGQASVSLNCTSKVVVTLAVRAGVNQTESISATLTDAVGLDGSVKTLKQPYVITLQKSPKYIGYQLTYLQSFNNRPTEQTRAVGPGFNGFFDPCEDRPNAPASTCDPVLDSVGRRVQDSQGFCCYCSLSQDLGFDPYTGTRGDITCSLFGSQMASGHCLQMDPLWYYGYRIGPASTYFEILITITKLSSTSGRVVSQETLSLSPSSQTVTNAARTVQVTLQGDLLSYTSAPTFESKFLLIPFTAGQAKTYEGSSKYMLVDQTLFTLDGRECNKIGVSYSAFRNQNNACGTTAGTCLANQPHDLYTADQAARARGVKGQYFASNFGQLSVNQFSATAGALDPTVQYLAYIDQQLSNSIVTLQLAADSIQFITNRASGVITTWFAPKFEAMSGNGLIIVSVRSTGTLNADFSVSVTQCSFGVLPTQSNTLTISAGSSLNFSFPVTSALVTSSSNQCVAILRDSQAVVIDTKLVYFNVSTLSENRGAQGGERQPTGSGTTVQHASSSDCSVKCPSFFGLLCFFTNACWTNLLYLIGAGLGAVVLTCCGLCNIDKIIGCWWKAMSHCRWSDDEHKPHELIRPNRKRNRKRHMRQIDVNNKLDIDKIPIVTYEQAREMLSPGKPTAKQQQHDRDRLLTRDHDGNYSIEMTEATESSLP